MDGRGEVKAEENWRSKVEWRNETVEVMHFKVPTLVETPLLGSTESKDAKQHQIQIHVHGAADQGGQRHSRRSLDVAFEGESRTRKNNAGMSMDN